MADMADVRFELVAGWEKRPDGDGYSHRDVAGVACDSEDRVYLHTRGGDRVMVYGADGTFLRKWGDGVFSMAHGITIHDDVVYCTDNIDSVVRMFDLEGVPLGMLGDPKRVSDTGYANLRGRTPAIHHNEFVERAAGPFNCCCNVCIAQNRDVFVADGYGNARIHHFDAAGTLLHSWGEVGTGPGQFHLPHGIALDACENVIVCDRENDRLQFFDRSGRFLKMWTDVLRPTDCVVDSEGMIYVAELWRPIERGQGSFVHGYEQADRPGRVSVFSPDGQVVARWGDEGDRTAPGNFIAPHGLSLDSKGDLYVAEVSCSFGALPGRLSVEDCIDHQIQKFRRIR